MTEFKGFADLHRHLDGSLRRTTVDELAAQNGVEVPYDLAFHAGMGLPEALSKFAFTLSLLQKPEEVKRVASEICEDAATEGVSTLEIRFAPQLHKGAAVEEIVDAALEGIGGRAGLILCGLYGEPLTVLDSLVEIAKTRPGVVGIDLAGGPDDPKALLAYKAPFQKAMMFGLGRTCHAAEGRSAEEIRLAIEELGCNRIGHGTTLLSDESVVELVIARNVTIEACLTSNVHVGAIEKVSDHGLVEWLQRGVRCTVSPDNTLLSQTNSAIEHGKAYIMNGMTQELYARLVQNGHDGAFRR